MADELKIKVNIDTEDAQEQINKFLKHNRGRKITDKLAVSEEKVSESKALVSKEDSEKLNKLIDDFEKFLKLSEKDLKDKSKTNSDSKKSDKSKSSTSSTTEEEDTGSKKTTRSKKSKKEEEEQKKEPIIFDSLKDYIDDFLGYSEKITKKAEKSSGKELYGIDSLIKTIKSNIPNNLVSGASGAISLMSTLSQLSLLGTVVNALASTFKVLYKTGSESYELETRLSNSLKALDTECLNTSNALKDLNSKSMSLSDALEFIGKSSREFVGSGIGIEVGTEISDSILSVSKDIASEYRFQESPTDIASKIISDINTGGTQSEQYGIRVSDDYVKAWAMATKGLDLYNASVSKALMTQLRYEKALKDASVYANSYYNNSQTLSNRLYESTEKLQKSTEQLQKSLQPVYELTKNISSTLNFMLADFISGIVEFFDRDNKISFDTSEVTSGLDDVIDKEENLLKQQENINAAYAGWNEYIEKVKSSLFGFEDLTVLTPYITDENGEMSGVKAEITTELDDETTEEDVGNLVDVINDELGEIDSVYIQADIDEATGKVKGFSQIITDVDGKTVEIYSELKDMMTVKEFEELINDKLPEDKQIRIDTDTGLAVDNLNNVANIMDILEESTGSYDAALRELKSLMESFTDITAAISIYTSGLDYEGILKIKNAVDSLSSKEVTVNFKANTSELDSAINRLNSNGVKLENGKFVFDNPLVFAGNTKYYNDGTPKYGSSTGNYISNPYLLAEVNNLTRAFNEARNTGNDQYLEPLNALNTIYNKYSGGSSTSSSNNTSSVTNVFNVKTNQLFNSEATVRNKTIKYSNYGGGD